MPLLVRHRRSESRSRPSEPRSRPSEPHVVSSPAQRKALAFFAVAAALALVLLSLPVASGLFLGTLLAFSLLRVHDRLSRWLHRRTLSALLLALSSALATVGGLALLLYFVVVRGMHVANRVASGFEPEGPLRKALDHLSDATQNSVLGHIDVVARVRAAAGEAASELTSAVGAIAGATLSVLLALFFTTMTAFFVLRHWQEILQRAERMLPLHPMHTRVVLSEFQKVGKEVFIGTMLTGVVQGVLASVGYVLAGAPEPALLGALTAMCSLLPAVGTALVWASVGIGLLLTGHPGAGAVELVWGLLIVVGLSDYVIRPKLVGGGGHVPTLLTFVALFGGLEVFGILGLIVGPVVAAVALAILRTYDREIREGSA